VLDRIRRALDGGRDELSRDNLLQRVVDEVLGLRERGRMGADTLPPEVGVHLQVPPDRFDVVRSFVEDPFFDRDVEAELANRVAAPIHQLPLRAYVVETGEAVSITASGRAMNIVLRVFVEGGDRGGREEVLPARLPAIRLGRGPWHGSDQREPNDLIVSDADSFVSRRAARMKRVGGGWEVAALDQGQCLVVLRADGSRVRPHNSPKGWVHVLPGEAIELNDGAQQSVIVRFALEQTLVEPE
jgi:hypothetical protein